MNDLDPRDTEGQAKQLLDQAFKANRLKTDENSLYALVFNNEAGQRLLEQWQEKYVHTWIANPNDTLLGIGHKQGQANFVMDIKNRLKQMEKGVDNG